MESRTTPLQRAARGCALLLIATLGLHSAPVLAHAMLVKAEPPRRAVLKKPPTQVRLWFNEEVEKDYPLLSIYQADKTPIVDRIKPEVSADDPRSIVHPLPELAPGKYTVEYKVLSVDGHTVKSSYDFTIKSQDPSQ
ncbi:copper resistance CopC family protein [Nitrosovibrio sp. Nv17]|uniref:copper resistance CopC family protein n=1 Tax=Nitrosovibrio sp. Nv17 TaxID=1855339 RepID=UPI0009089CE4|nr:copper resistance CopC family protein [Nitrosovibrio sp. Nv17]SFW17229.1 hypothetical protein SAMN05216414_1044 [Nitrosovibrio sp. Nv17]SFW31701.1 hypothetical protein SAMN05216414_11569 [Nitrosovibrio sp. Nv17]